MILSWMQSHKPFNFSILDAETGECLDKEGIQFADDEHGLYYRTLRNERGNRYLVNDSSTGDQVVATELVHRKIRIIRKHCEVPECL